MFGVFRPLRPLFYSRYAGNIYCRRRKDEFEEVIHALKNYHESIKLIIKLSPSKLLDTQLINVNNILQKFTERKGKYLYTDHQKYQSNIREKPLQRIYTKQKI